MSDNSITIRNLTRADLPRAAELWLACFPEDDAEFVSYYFSRRTKPSNMLGLFEDGLLVSMLSFDETRMCSSGAPDGVSVSFVAGVCTEPGKRRRGYVRRLFATLEETLKERGVQAILLVPFDFGFYATLGFAPYAVREVAEYSAPEALAVVQIGDGAKEALEIQGDNGTIRAGRHWWRGDYFEIERPGKADPERYSTGYDGNGLKYVLKDFGDALRTGNRRPVTLTREESERIAEIMEVLHQ